MDHSASQALLNSDNQSARDLQYVKELEHFFPRSPGSNIDKLRNFPKYVPTPAIGRFLVRNELFRRILEVHGNIIECGVFLGGGLFSWAQLSVLYEPLNHTRRIIGFDTFEGFPDISEKDRGEKSEAAVKGGYAANSLHDLEECARLFDLTRPISHIPKFEMVAGNAVQTMPEYLRRNPHLVVALLYLDFDIYEPTVAALHTFLPRMPRGAVIAFDELNMKQWPGETLAVLEQIGLSRLSVRRFPFQPQISYAVLD
jgi:hypothetical protein